MTNNIRFATILFVIALVPGVVRAQVQEWPGVYYPQCGSCHGDAQGILEERAILKDGTLLGRRSNRDIRDFIGRHFGQRNSGDVETIYMELLRVAQGGGRFRRQCAICHVSAEELARRTLILKDGSLYGRYTGRPIAEFLIGHGRLAKQEDAAFFEQVLKRSLPVDR